MNTSVGLAMLILCLALTVQRLGMGSRFQRTNLEQARSNYQQAVAQHGDR